MKFTFSFSFGIDVERKPKPTAREIELASAIAHRMSLGRLYQIVGVERG